MKHLTAFVAALALSSMLSACAYHIVTPPARGSVRLYSAARPTCAFAEVGLVTASGGFLASNERIESEFVNAIIDLRGDAAIDVQHRVSGLRLRTLTGTAIRFTNRDCRQ